MLKSETDYIPHPVFPPDDIGMADGAELAEPQHLVRVILFKFSRAPQSVLDVFTADDGITIELRRVASRKFGEVPVIGIIAWIWDFSVIGILDRIDRCTLMRKGVWAIIVKGITKSTS